MTYARRGGFLDRGRFQPAGVRHRPARHRGHRHHATARPGRGEAGACEDAGIRLSSASALHPRRVGSRHASVGHPRRHRDAGTGHSARRPARPPDVEAGAEGRPASPTDRRRGRGRPDRRVLRPLAGEQLPRPARQRRRRPDRQPARPRRHQLRRRRRLRQFAVSAVHLAAMELQTGRADVVVTGGVDTFNDIFMYMCFSKTPALSPTGDAKPFDADGDGTILGEGLGMVVLKRLADAERDGDRIYAVIRGIGSSSDGKGNAIYAPERRRADEGPARTRTSRPASRPTRSSWSRPTAPARRSATPPRSTALTEVFTATARRRSRPPGARSGLGEVADRPHQGGGRRRGAHQGGARAAPQGAAADASR